MMDWLTEAVLISASLVCVSFVVIGILFQHARRRLRQIDEITSLKEPKKNPFWIERMYGHNGSKHYLAISFSICVIVIIADYFVPILIMGPNPWWWNIKPI
jgi:hypothetical protein